MPELRLNVITRDWVVMATERAMRPDEFAAAERARPPVEPYDPECPFCPGNEGQTEGELYSTQGRDGWQLRVVPNKFPALVATGERRRRGAGLFHVMDGVGFHEVVIEHPRHDLTIATMTEAEVAEVLQAYRDRYAAVRRDPRVEAVIIFKNHGEAAGTSLCHPHSQLAATPVVPFQVRARLTESVRFFDEHGECIFCRVMRDELASGERIILESEHFVVFHPFAALSPFHTWIFPRRHAASFDDAGEEELVDFARVLRRTLRRLRKGLNDPPYNYAIRSVPVKDANPDYFHWYMTIIPRVTRVAGFEMGSGMFINTSLPEESAEYLRGIPDEEG